MPALLLRNAVPLMLLALCLLVWGERCVPGRDRAVEALGEDGLLRFVVGMLCLLIYVLWINQQRLVESLTRLLKIFKEAQEERIAGKGDAMSDEQKNEAARLLVASLASDDAELRGKSRAHLRRLTGQDFGEDAAQWRGWLDGQS